MAGADRRSTPSEHHRDLDLRLRSRRARHSPAIPLHGRDFPGPAAGAGGMAWPSGSPSADHRRDPNPAPELPGSPLPSLGYFVGPGAFSSGEGGRSRAGVELLTVIRSLLPPPFPPTPATPCDRGRSCGGWGEVLAVGISRRPRASPRSRLPAGPACSAAPCPSRRPGGRFCSGEGGRSWAARR